MTVDGRTHNLGHKNPIIHFVARYIDVIFPSNASNNSGAIVESPVMNVSFAVDVNRCE